MRLKQPRGRSMIAARGMRLKPEAAPRAREDPTDGYTHRGSRRPWQTRVGRSQRAVRLAAGSVSGFATALPEPAGLNGTERTSAGCGRAEALERVAVRRQHLSFRSPLSYFHNGLAANLGEVIDFYSTRFGVSFTAQEKSDLIAFLRTL